MHCVLELRLLVVSSILAEGAIALSVRLSGGALFASWKLLQFPSSLIVKVILAIFMGASAQQKLEIQEMAGLLALYLKPSQSRAAAQQKTNALPRSELAEPNGLWYILHGMTEPNHLCAQPFWLGRNSASPRRQTICSESCSGFCAQGARHNEPTMHKPSNAHRRGVNMLAQNSAQIRKVQQCCGQKMRQGRRRARLGHFGPALLKASRPWMVQRQQKLHSVSATLHWRRTRCLWSNNCGNPIKWRMPALMVQICHIIGTF